MQGNSPPSGSGNKLNRAVSLHRTGQLAEAKMLYREILQEQPLHFDALHLLGVASQQDGDSRAAIELIGQALKINPAFADAHSNLGNALRDLKRLDEALACYDRALQLRPDYVEPLYNRGLALQELWRHEEAIACYRRALALRPDYAEAINNLGIALRESGRHEQSVQVFARLLEVAPDYAYAAGNLMYARLQCCDWEHYAADAGSIGNAVMRGERACDPFSLAAISGSAAAMLQCARTYAADKYPAAAIPLRNGKLHDHGRIRLAYLSADFHDHATAYLMAELFEKHDRERFELTAISFGPDAAGGMRERLLRAFDRFVDIRTRTDREAALLLRDLEIDIAIDLKGYTQNNRTGVLACRAAPIQVNYLGYPGSMGVGYIDYILADAQVIPPGQEKHYTEQVVRLPDSYQANDTRRRIAQHTPTRAEAGLPENGLVFCCFNNNYKIAPDMFDIWMRLLGRVQGSVLWLLQDNPAASRNLRQEASRRGIDPQRLVFAPRMALDAHLARHRRADLFLDTLPYNAHTTASDALWAGLPLLACPGETFAGRVAASLLHAAGLPELVSGSLEEYESLALRLATNPAELAGLRARLRQNLASCALFDTGRFCRNLESAYATMWQRHRLGEPPQGFDVA
jgi:protein O-GlcNAc transferase